MCSSPQLFAAYHVFLRLSVPRHPPCALSCLTSRPLGPSRLAWRYFWPVLVLVCCFVLFVPDNAQHLYRECSPQGTSGNAQHRLASDVLLSRLFANVDTFDRFVIRFSRYKESLRLLLSTKAALEKLRFSRMLGISDETFRLLLDAWHPFEWFPTPWRWRDSNP